MDHSFEHLPVPDARDLMQPVGWTLSPEGDLLDGVDRLVDEAAPGALVVADDGRLKGILTEKDCLRLLSVSAFYHAYGGKVASLMSPVRVVIAPDMDLFRVAEQFLEGNYPILPVVDGGKAIGQITRQDLLEAIQKLRRRMDKEAERAAQASEDPNRPRSIEDMQQSFARLSRQQLVTLLGRRR